MTLQTVYSRNPGFVQRDVAGECILVPIKRQLTDVNSIYVLNDTGAALWNKIDGKRSVQEIQAAFREEYDVPTEQLQHDCETLLTDLLSIHAIEEVSVTDGQTR